MTDLDGVLTRTARVHARAWTEAFDDFLSSRAGQAPFQINRDYPAYVDGKRRYDGVDVYPRAIQRVKDLRRRRLRTAVVSSSENGAAVLEAAGITALFDARVDGADLERCQLRGKPAPDMFLEAASRLACEPPRAIGVEDALAGAEALAGRESTGTGSRR